MMPFARATDITSGHGCFPPELAAARYVSKDVYVETKGVLRKDDRLLVHCCGKSCHEGKAAGGSATVFVNRKESMRLGDRVQCPNGSAVMITSASRTFCGG